MVRSKGATEARGRRDNAEMGCERGFPSGAMAEGMAEVETVLVAASRRMGGMSMVDPTTETVICEVIDAAPANVDTAVTAARRAFEAGPTRPRSCLAAPPRSSHPSSRPAHACNPTLTCKDRS